MTSRKPDRIPKQPYWGLDGRSFLLLKAQMAQCSPGGRLEVRLIHVPDGPDQLEFFVHDPHQAAERLNAPVDDTWHCPPFCK